MNGPASPAPLSNAIPTRARFTLSAWLAGAAASAYLARQCLVVAESTIRSDLGLSEQQMGVVVGLFFLSYAVCQIPGGWLGEQFGARCCLPAFAVIWSIATAACGLASGVTLLVAGRAASGIAQAGLFPCAADTISRWNSLTERALASGLLSAAMQGGAIIAAPLTGILLDVVSWRAVFAICALPGLVWAVGFFVWFRDRIEDHPSVNEAEIALVRKGRAARDDSTEDVREVVPWLRLLTDRALWLICAQQFFRAGAYVLFASWFATYLQEGRGVSREASGWLTAIPLLTSLIASLISGGLSDLVLSRTGSYSLARNGVAVISLVFSSILMILAYFIADATWATVSIGAGAFFAACAGPCAYAATIDMGGRHVASVFGTMNMAGNLGAALLSMIVPHFRQMVEHSPALLEMFDGNSWNAILVLFAGMYLLAAVCWLPLPSRGALYDDGSPIGESPDD